MLKEHALDYHKWDEFLINTSPTRLEPKTQTTKTTLLRFPLCQVWSSFDTQWEYITKQTKEIIEKLHPDVVLEHKPNRDMCTHNDGNIESLSVAFKRINRYNSDEGWVAAYTVRDMLNYRFFYSFHPEDDYWEWKDLSNIISPESTAHEKHTEHRGVLEGYPPEYWHPWQVAWGIPNADRNPVTLGILAGILAPFIIVIVYSYLSYYYFF